MTFLITALGMFMAFNILPAFGDGHRGWSLWPVLWSEMLHDPQFIFKDTKAGIVITSFLCFSLLIVVSPFLKNVWPKSNLTWWLAVVFSGLTTAGFWSMCWMGGSYKAPELGLWCLLFAPGMNFIGLLLAGEKRRVLDGMPG